MNRKLKKTEMSYLSNVNKNDSNFQPRLEYFSFPLFINVFCLAKQISEKRTYPSTERRDKILEVAMVTDEITSLAYPEYNDTATVMLIIGNIVSTHFPFWMAFF